MILMAVIGCLAVVFFFTKQESRGDIIVLGIIVFLATAIYSGYQSANLYKSTGVGFFSLTIRGKIGSSWLWAAHSSTQVSASSG